ncbi:MAG: hypothetical protein LPL00_04185 [Alphaproteobacteria bacterium]|nr:hypothetical protein [Alphaproteobacteria bacterium]MDX5368694.1 hypothetical protein [Alphaproteobacteria bacterium]MDX5463436.1 hypothetical protein [Alphaproteobacteria bacterium]
MLGGLLLLISIAAIYLVCFWLIANEGKPDAGAHGILALRTGEEIQAAKRKGQRKNRAPAVKTSEPPK